MKTFILLSMMTLCGFLVAYGQTFSDVNAGLENMGRSDVAWGDFDNDNDLDLLISGIAGYDGSDDFKSILYRNDEGVFVDIEAGLPGIANCHNEWGDVDGDGDLDIIMIGGNPGNVLYLFENDNGIFTEMETNLPSVGKDGVVRWEDFDRDGDLDLFLGAYYTTDVFRNGGDGVFTAIGAGFPSMNSCMADWGDYDNDGDADLIICGNDGAGGFCDIYRNDDGAFVGLAQPFVGLFAGEANFVDMDSDGDLDVFMSGYDETLTPHAKMYINDIGFFFELPAGVTSMALGAVTFGDMDNDGDMDLFMSGNVAGCGNLGAIIYRNDNGSFYTHNAPITGIVRADGEWGDFDNDGDMDLVVTGFTGSSVPYTRLFRNELGDNTYTVNNPPAIVENMDAVITNNDVILQWDSSTDDHTGTESISYNVYLGNLSATGNIVSPNAIITSGKRLIAEVGNAGMKTEYAVNNLPPGDYYWSVQAIDQSFVPSAFSDEGYFSIVGTGIQQETQENIGVFPNPATDFIVLNGDASADISIYDLAGKQVAEHFNVSAGDKIYVNNLNGGLYILKVIQGNSIQEIKFLKH